jgi:ferric-dicitrate binding protein FerR (iron transport regulator)
MKENEIRYELIARELTSDITEAELELLEQELDTDENLNSNFHTLKKFWFQFFPPSPSHQILEKTEKKLDLTYVPDPQNQMSTIYKIAAAFFFLFSVGLTIYFFKQPEENIQLTSYTCGPGEVKEIVLSDGSHVWLNNTSTLITVEPFQGETRVVTLRGEAYFEIAHNADKPFIVESGKLKTEVLGTRFNITAYPETGNQAVTLYEGSVKLRPAETPHKSLLMKPGEKVTVDNNSQFFISSVATDKAALWRNGILRFNNEELSQIASDLERKFNTRIVIASEKAAKLRFTAEFDEEPLEKILALLNEAKKFDYDITQNGIFIRSLK